ncbi:MAG TPA: tetratricopeptide repeat protein [Xanthobacteraceae bacterium]|nr:tetratricopeptide repeat protein [Xanthobacteraceae bacterium]
MRRPVVLGALAIAALLAALAGGDRGGRLLLVAGLPAPAAALLKDPAWRGVALYRAGRFTDAEAMLRSTRSPEAAYNLGNAFAQTGQFAAAVKAYDIALKRNPGDADALANRALVLEALKATATAAKGKAAGAANATATKESAGDTLQGDDAGVQSASGDGMAGQREAGSDTASIGSSRVDRRGDPQAGASESGLGSSKGAATDSAGRAGRSGGSTIAARSDAPPPRRAEALDAAGTGQATLQWLATLPDDPARFLRLRIAAEHQRRVAAGTAPRPGTSPGASPW